MTVPHGSTADVYVAGWDFGDVVHAVTSSMQRPVEDKTVLNNSGWRSFQPSPIIDGAMQLEGWYDTNATDALAVDKAIEGFFDGVVGATSDLVSVIHWPAGNLAVGDYGWGMNGYIDKKDLRDGETGLVSCSIGMQATGTGRERLRSHGTMANRSSASNSTTVDNLVATSNGGAGYICAPTFTSGTLNATIDHSSNDIAYAALVTFPAVTANNAGSRVAVTGSVLRYTRGAWATTFNVTFALAFARNP